MVTTSEHIKIVTASEHIYYPPDGKNALGLREAKEKSMHLMMCVDLDRAFLFTCPARLIKANAQAVKKLFSDLLKLTSYDVYGASIVLRKHMIEMGVSASFSQEGMVDEDLWICKNLRNGGKDQVRSRIPKLEERIRGVLEGKRDAICDKASS